MNCRRASLFLLAVLTVCTFVPKLVNAAQVAYWNFDTDFSATYGGPTYNATPVNGASISSVQSKFGGGSAHFDKSTMQHAFTAASPVPADSFSYSLWYYLDVDKTGPVPNRQFSPFGTGGPGDAYTIHFNIDGSGAVGNNDDILVFHSNTVDGVAQGLVPEIVEPLPNPWDHRTWQNVIGTVTYNSGADETTLEAFHNGVSLGTSSAPGTPTPTSYLAFGIDRGLSMTPAGGRFWEGYVDDVAVYDHVLTAGEIAALQTGPAGVPANKADFDDDGDVDGTDFLRWQRGFGTGTTHAEGDANFSGNVDGSDLTIWQSQYGGSQEPPGRATLWQLPLVDFGNSYVVQSPSGRIAVFDGGSDHGGSGIFGGGGAPIDATYLKNFLTSLGGHVDAWFLSHPHTDHVSVLTTILESPDLQGLMIDNIYAHLPSESWLEQYEPVNMLPAMLEFKAALAARGMTVVHPTVGQEIDLDSLKFQILTEIDETNDITDPNDYSMVVRLTTPETSVLFLGDLGVEGGELLLAGPFGDQLASDYVQMAHHGNWGVTRKVYEAVAAKYALWPAPAWLYDAPQGNPEGYDSWQVRQWMNELGVLENYIMKDGLIEIGLSQIPGFETSVAVPEPTAVILALLGMSLSLMGRSPKK